MTSLRDLFAHVLFSVAETRLRGQCCCQSPHQRKTSGRTSSRCSETAKAQWREHTHGCKRRGGDMSLRTFERHLREADAQVEKGAGREEGAARRLGTRCRWLVYRAHDGPCFRVAFDTEWHSRHRGGGNQQAGRRRNSDRTVRGMHQSEGRAALDRVLPGVRRGRPRRGAVPVVLQRTARPSWHVQAAAGESRGSTRRGNRCSQ